MYLNIMEDTYAIVNINDLSKVDFSQVGQTSADTVRRSIDETMFVLKWEQTPTFISDDTIKPLQILTYSECLNLMETAEWTEMN